MKIALIGYGKMGKQIEEIAIAAGHEILCIIDEKNSSEIKGDQFKSADVAIEFSTPDFAVSNIIACLDAKVPVVCGTTGWYNHLQEIEKLCQEKNGSVLYSSNFSLGVNLFFEMNRKVSEMMKKYPIYQIHLEETHHIHKKDAPSGTALSLSKDILHSFPNKKSVKTLLDNQEDNGINQDELIIRSWRKDEVPGTHDIVYSSPEDEILLRHTANNRAGFAKGAIMAAEWLYTRSGFFTMQDVLKDEL